MVQIDRNDDMVPPWEEFPTYERYTMGWRMGTGEDYFCDWHTFIEKLPSDFKIEYVSSEWESVESQLLTGHLGDIDPTDGLLTLARMLCAGLVQPPWELDLSPDNFTDSFEMDMGYTDAFRLWIMSAFDDDLLLREMLHKTGIPANWADWVKEHAET
jgi:hypothetical protein